MGRDTLITELRCALEDLIELAISQEVQIDGEFGSCRSWDEIVKDGEAPIEIEKAKKVLDKSE